MDDPRQNWAEIAVAVDGYPARRMERRISFLLTGLPKGVLVNGNRSKSCDEGEL